MNDYWNDPPESQDPPMCCDEFMDINQDGSCKCSICGKEIKPHPDPEPDIEESDPASWDMTTVPMGDKCPHGNEWFNCDTCNVASDIAYDSNRENKR